jgi:5-carboxymethyl-2-hydroxymuconate isomerase
MKIARIPALNQEFAIGKIVCIGRNYVDHIHELGNETPTVPVIFIKPATAVIGDGETVCIPACSNDCHYEAELAVLIGCRCKDVPVEQALSRVAGYGVAIDMTLRDLQDNLKKKGLPWETAKGFDTACPLSDFAPASQVTDPQSQQVTLKLNGEERQHGSTGLMIHTVAQVISHMSSFFTLEPGDVILTGTPAGVGRVVSGDCMEAEVPGVARLKVTVQ